MSSSVVVNNTVTTKIRISKDRNKREKSIAVTFVKFDKQNGTKPIHTLICHKHFGGHLLVGLNSRNLPVKAWTTNRAYMPIRAKYIHDPSKLNNMIRNSIKPQLVYMNDAEVLTPFPSTTTASAAADPFEIIFYEGTLCDLLRSLNNITATNNKQSSISCNDDNSIPSYEFVKKLDKSISYDDYKLIYMI